jgi:hypothetical protein
MRAVAPAELHCLRKKMPSAPDGVMLDGAGGVAGGTTDSGTRGAGVGAGLALGVLVGVVERTAVGSDGVLVDVIVAVGVDVVVTVGEGVGTPEQRASRGIKGLLSPLKVPTEMRLLLLSSTSARTASSYEPGATSTDDSKPTRASTESIHRKRLGSSLKTVAGEPFTDSRRRENSGDNRYPRWERTNT